jgi:hypothetical protein
MRNVPDVAMVADSVYVKYGNGASGSFDGTSCAAPLWAGFAALMNQQAVTAGRPAVGFINPAIYHLGTNATYTACFHDTTVGDNTSSASPTLFYAVPGYDLCTGWGTPNGSNLVNAIAGPPLLGPLIVPASFTLVTETCPNGVVDPGETVVVALGLKNIGLANTTNLVATLQPTNDILSPSGPATYGVLNPGDPESTRMFTFTAGGTCGGPGTATLQLQDGTANLGTVTFSFTLGQRSSLPILSQSFDSVTPPALPAGWTVSSSGAGPAWATSSALCDTAPNAAFVRDPNSPSDNSLISPSFAISGPLAQLSFRHNFYTETYYDGGALEISIGAGAFTDILIAGGSFLTNGYTQTISACCGNPLANRPAWTGSSGGFITSVVNLPPAAAGHMVQLRWRFCSDDMIGATGWYIDTISVIDGYACCTANQPLIESITRSSAGLLIVWSSTSNQIYRLQFTTNLNPPNWTDVPGDVVASGPAASKTDSMSSDAQRFYRVIALP